MKVEALAAALLVTALCTGCLHSPPNYPGAGGDNIDPARYLDSDCPDLSGTYEGVGVLLDGDATAQRWESTMSVDYNFPFASDAELKAFMSVSASDGPGRSAIPISGEIEMIGRRSFRFSVDYANGKRASRVVSFEKKTRFVCTGANGKVIWGGASEGGRSEFGPNSSDSSVTVYLDEQGNLITERTMQVHMTLLAGLIPAGTVQYFSTHRFKRLR